MNKHNGAAPHAARGNVHESSNETNPFLSCLRARVEMTDAGKRESAPLFLFALHTAPGGRRLAFAVNTNSGRGRNVKNGVKTVCGDLPVFAPLHVFKGCWGRCLLLLQSRRGCAIR